jgi:hypothetical protein
MNNKELTIEEELYYFKYALIDICDVCGEYVPITNNNDGNNYLEYNGVQLLCNKCK